MGVATIYCVCGTSSGLKLNLPTSCMSYKLFWAMLVRLYDQHEVTKSYPLSFIHMGQGASVCFDPYDTMQIRMLCVSLSIKYNINMFETHIYSTYTHTHEISRDN